VSWWREPNQPRERDAFDALMPKEQKPMTEPDLQRMERQWLPDNVPPLIAEVRRLQGLIKQAEWAAGIDYPHESESRGSCPWCGCERPHAKFCQAFPPVG
jgi:hypothetical protein